MLSNVLSHCSKQHTHSHCFQNEQTIEKFLSYIRSQKGSRDNGHHQQLSLLSVAKKKELFRPLLACSLFCLVYCDNKRREILSQSGLVSSLFPFSCICLVNGHEIEKEREENAKIKRHKCFIVSFWVYERDAKNYYYYAISKMHCVFFRSIWGLIEKN